MTRTTRVALVTTDLAVTPSREKVSVTPAAGFVHGWPAMQTGHRRRPRHRSPNRPETSAASDNGHAQGSTRAAAWPQPALVAPSTDHDLVEGPAGQQLGDARVPSCRARRGCSPHVPNAATFVGDGWTYWLNVQVWPMYSDATQMDWPVRDGGAVVAPARCGGSPSADGAYSVNPSCGPRPVAAYWRVDRRRSSRRALRTRAR